MQKVDAVLKRLRSMADAKVREGMGRFGIQTDRAVGIPLPVLRRMAAEIGVDHKLAGELWKSGVHEARLLAAFVADPAALTGALMDRWVKDFDSWDVCDQATCSLFYKNPLSWKKALEWSRREPEFEKRGGFALMAGLAWLDKEAKDVAFNPFFAAIVREAKDDRNFVKKAVNWALRNIGKRNQALNRKAIEVAKRIAKIDSRAARWIASDALRELASDKIRRRLASGKPRRDL